MDQSKLTIGTFDADALLAMADLVKPTLLRHTVQLFTREHKPEPEASGVVVRYRGEVFLFTAAHALAAFKERPLWLMVRDVLVKMEGPLFMGFTGTPDLGDHFGDPMDAAVVLLPEKIATDLDAFALDDGQFPKAPDMAYYLTAFPAHRTEVDTQDEEIWVTPIARVFAEADETVPTNTHCFQKALTRPAGRREWWADLGADVARNIRAP